MMLVKSIGISELASTVAVLMLLQVGLGTVMVCLLVFCMLPFGATTAVCFGLVVHVIGFTTSRVLSDLLPRFALAWPMCFVAAPAVVLPFAAYRHGSGDHQYAFVFWLAFTVTLAAAGIVGSARGTAHPSLSY